MQSSFRRYEKKYLVTQEQYATLHDAISRRMAPDQYGEYLVQNLYYDTEDWAVIRASVEKPSYKEKMRLRCYGVPDEESEFFLELKKKHKGVVYKRRIAIPGKTLSDKSVRDVVSEGGCQVAREIDFFMRGNAVFEKIYISYRRVAFAGVADEGLRVTFDRDILFRLNRLDYVHPEEGCAILPPGKTLMEIKALGGMPIWLARALSENGIFPTAFSKYGVCYIDHILNPSWAEADTKGKVRISA